MDTTLTIQQVAALSGLTPHTLRYYEKIGLIQPVARAAGGQRRYAARDLDWIAFLLRLRATRMPIAAMQRYAVLRERPHDPGSIVERKRILVEHSRQVAAEIDALQEALGHLAHKIAHYDNLERQAHAPQPTLPAGSRTPA